MQISCGSIHATFKPSGKMARMEVYESNSGRWWCTEIEPQAIKRLQAVPAGMAVLVILSLLMEQGVQAVCLN